MKYPYPEKTENIKDILCWFSGYYKNKFGYYLPKKDWGKTASFIKIYKKKGYSLEDIALVIWGTCNTNNYVRSIWYCKYFFNQIDKFEKIKQKYFQQQKRDSKIKYIEEETDKGDDFFEKYL